MDQRQLRALIAVGDHRSFSAAAKALLTVQSNISTHVSRLEGELGVTLVDRGTMELTDEGRLVVELTPELRGGAARAEGTPAPPAGREETLTFRLAVPLAEGGAPASQEIVADVQGGPIWLSSLGNLGDTGAVREIAVTLPDQRWNKYPNLPTFDELGLKDYEITTWVSMYAPKGTPPEVAEKLTAALNAALADPAVQQRLDKAGIVKPKATGPDFLKKYLNNEIEKWTDVLRTTKDTD